MPDHAPRRARVLVVHHPDPGRLTLPRDLGGGDALRSRRARRGGHGERLEDVLALQGIQGSPGGGLEGRAQEDQPKVRVLALDAGRPLQGRGRRGGDHGVPALVFPVQGPPGRQP